MITSDQKQKTKYGMNETEGSNFDDYPGFQPKTTPAQRYATQCTYNSMTMQILRLQQVC